jgi:hypothetical protein
MARLNFTIAIPQPARRNTGFLRTVGNLTLLSAAVCTLRAVLPADALPLRDWLQAALECWQSFQSGFVPYLLHVLHGLV